MSENEDLFGRWRNADIIEYFTEAIENANGQEGRSPGATYAPYKEGARDFWFESYLNGGERVVEHLEYKEAFGVY